MLTNYVKLRYNIYIFFLGGMLMAYQIIRTQPKKLPEEGLFVTCIPNTRCILLKTIKNGRFVMKKAIDKDDFSIEKCSEPTFIDYKAAELLNLEDALVSTEEISCKHIKSGESVEVKMDAQKLTDHPIAIDLNQIRQLIQSIGWS